MDLKESLRQSFAELPAPEVTPPLAGSVVADENGSQAQPDAVAEGSTPEGVAPEGQQETPKEGDEGEQPKGQDPGDELPTEYLGVDLSGLEDEARAELLKLVKGSDKFANQKAQEAAKSATELEELRKEVDELKRSATTPKPEGDTNEVFEVPEDAAIAQAFGWDADDDLTELRIETVKPLLSPIMEMQQQVEALVEHIQFQDRANNWQSTLSQLDPNEEVDHEKLVDFAVERGLEDNPEQAFELFVGPQRNQLREATLKQREAAMREVKKKTSDGLGKSREGSEKEPQVTSFRDAIDAAQQETGKTLASLFQR